MAQRNQCVYEFGPFRVNAAEHALVRDGRTVPLAPKVFDVLLVLLENAGHVVSKDLLMEAVWPDTFVEEGNLATAVYTLRKTFGEDSQFIETVPKRGYRFVGDAREIPEDDSSVPDAATLVPAVEAAEAPTPLSELVVEPTAMRDDGPRAASRPVVALVALACLAAAAAASAWFRASPAAPAAPAPTVRSLAVLPFAPIGEGAEQDHLGLGMADALIMRLGNIRQVLVRPTSAIRKYDGQKTDALDAGRELNVDLVVDGSIQTAGDRVRTTVQLVSVRDGTTVWTKSFDEPFTDIFSLQDAIAEQLASALPLELTTDERSLLAKPHSEDAETYRLYEKGLYFWGSSNDNSSEMAMRYFREAIARDPNFALGHAGLASTYGGMGKGNEMRPDEAWPMCEAEVRRALELDDSLPEAHNDLAASLLFYRWDLPAAERESERTIALDPTFGEARNIHAYCLLCLGRVDEAIAERRRMLELEPTAGNAFWGAGTTYYYARRYDEAIATFKEFRDTYPNVPQPHKMLARFYTAQGKPDEAEAELRKQFVMEQRDELVAIIDREYPKTGYPGVVRAVARYNLERMRVLSATQFFPAMKFAQAYIDLDDKDRAFEWLNRAVDERDWDVLTLGFSPEFDGLRADPRFGELIRRAGVVGAP